MSERALDTLRCEPSDLRQAMSIHTRKITDACRDKDCIEDLRVYLTTGSQEILDTAANVRVRCAELITTYIDVEPVAFNRSHYCIDLTFYYRVLADAMVGSNRPAMLYGLAVFTKRAVLCGEDSHAHIYRSDTRLGTFDGIPLLQSNRPTAVVEAVNTKQVSRMLNASGLHFGCYTAQGQFRSPLSSTETFHASFTASAGRLWIASAKTSTTWKYPFSSARMIGSLRRSGVCLFGSIAVLQ